MANPLRDLYNQVPEGYSANPKYQQYRDIIAKYPIPKTIFGTGQKQVDARMAALKSAGFDPGTYTKQQGLKKPGTYRPPTTAPMRFLDAQGNNADPTPLLTQFFEGSNTQGNPGMLTYMDRPLGSISGRAGEIDNQSVAKYNALYHAMETDPAYQNSPLVAQALTVSNPYYNALTKNEKSAQQHMAKVHKMQKLVRIAVIAAATFGVASYAGAFGAAGGGAGAAAGNAAADALVGSIPEATWAAAAAGDTAGLAALGGTLGTAGIGGSITGGLASGAGAAGSGAIGSGSLATGSNALSGSGAIGSGSLGTGGATAAGGGVSLAGADLGGNALSLGSGLGGAGSAVGGVGAAGSLLGGSGGAGTAASSGNFLSNLFGSSGSGGGLFSGSNLANLLGTVGSIGSGIYAGNQAEKAAKIQADAFKYAADLQQQQYLQGREDLAPWRNVGGGAVNKLGGLYGIGPDGQPLPGGAFGPEQIAEFERSPDYAFAVDQGQQAVDRSAAARGHLYSGEQMKANQRFGEGLATQNYNNYANRLAALADVGQNAVDTGIQAGQNYASNAGNARVGAAEARGSGYIGRANALAGGINNALNFYGNMNAPRYYR